MSRSVLPISPWLGAFASCVLTAGAAASDLTITGRGSESVELNDNYALTSGPKSGTLGSYSSGSFSALYRTPATRFILNGDISYRKYFGPATLSSSFSETTSDGLNMRFERDGNALGDKDYITASRARADAAIAQRSDFGFSTSTLDSDIITYAAGGGTSRRVDDRNVVSLSGTATQTTYSPSSATTTPFNSYAASGGWSHQATNIIDFNATSSLSFSKYNNTANTQTLSSITTGGVTIRLSDKLSINGSAGASIIKTTQDVAGPVVIVPVVTDAFNTPLFVPAPAIAGTTISPVWNASVNYTALKSTTVTFSAGQSTSQGTLGNFVNRTQLSASMNHKIDSVSSLSLVASASVLDAPSGGSGTGSTFMTAAASYSYQLSPDWYATGTYVYRQLENSATSSTGASTALSNSVLLVISRSFTLKP